MWEHAYYRDYLKDKKSYVFAMMKELNWDVVENRFKKSERISKSLK
jgi:superoxide dismutase